MARTVEEILKEEGVIKPTNEAKQEPAKEEKPDLTKIIISIEKLQTEVSTLRDFKQQNDEVLRELTEKIGEIRSLFFQRESLIKETETKVKTLDDIVSDISPTKYMKELDKINKDYLDMQAKMEKREFVERKISDDISSLKQFVENIKSIENLEKLLTEIQENVSKEREIKSDVQREAGKTERFYLEMEERIKEFIDVKDRIKKIEDINKELTRSIDVVNIRLAGFISRTDI